jgi:hypothetical protein
MCVAASGLTAFATVQEFWSLIKLRGLESPSELYRQSDRRLSAKLEPTFVDRLGSTWSA